MARFVAGVRALVVASDNVTAALADFAFNLGLRSLRASTLLRLTRAGDFKAGAEEFAKWKFAGGQVLPGLVRRRKAERVLYSS